MTISEVSRQFHVPRNNMMKISRQLVDLGYVHSERGKKGGIRLRARAGEINLRDVAVQMETSFEIISCYKPSCPIAGFCELKKALMVARDGFLEALSRYTIADLVRNKAQLLRLLDLAAA